MRDLMLDLRQAVRAIRAAPGPMFSAIATLALGIGMTTSIFSIVNGVVLRPLPFPHEERLVTLCENYPGATQDWCSISPPNIEDVASRSRSIEAIGIGRQWPFHIDTPTGAEAIDGGLATPGLFEALGVHAELGRLIEKSDLIGRESLVAVITHESWRSRFGGRADIIGQIVSLDKQPVTIVGVLAPGFALPRVGRMEIWRPLHIDPRDEQNREWRGFVSFARLRPGVSIDGARRELAGITRQLKADHFATTRDWGISLVSTRDLVIGNARPMLFLFLTAVGGVLLIGCANVANLLLARSASRTREVALRAALGASPARIVRGLLVESLVLAVLGTAGGIAIAFAATREFKALAPAGIPRVEEVNVNATVLLFALALAVATTFVFGLVPALRAARVDLSSALREGGRGASGRRSRLGPVLVAGELALAVVLVAGAGLLTRSFVTLTSWRPGFERNHLLTFSVFAPTATYSKSASVANVLSRIETEVASAPGVTAVGSASAGPLFGGRETWDMGYERDGQRLRGSVRWFDASPGFFATLGVPVVRGRALAETDVIGAPSVAVVNETLAARFWPGEDPLGKKLTFTVGKESQDFQVVGVVRDVPSLRPDDPVEPQLYWSNRQQPRPFSFFLVRTSVPPATIAASIAARLKLIDRDLEARNVRTMPQKMDDQLTTPRFTMLLVAGFGLAALFFAAIGTYGLLSYVVSLRRKEIGIRLALGARPAQVLRSVVRDGLALAAAGVGAGLVAVCVGGRAIQSLVVGVSAYDPTTLAASALLLLAVAAAAALIPAFRASRVDPVSTLGDS